MNFQWDNNAYHLIQNLKMGQKNCNSTEIIHISENVANARPYSNISHWWTLKWLLQNSPEFMEQLSKYTGNPLLIMKKRIFDLLGAIGFDRLEMAIPILRFRKLINNENY